MPDWLRLQTPNLDALPVLPVNATLNTAPNENPMRILISALMLLVLTSTTLAQVTIVDEDTQMPDYSDYYAGVEARDAGDIETAVTLFTQAADNGLAIAQYNLGVMYFTGEGVPQNYERSFHYTQLAAEQGHVNAMVNLGVLYYNQLGVQADWMAVWPLSLINRGRHSRKAAKWYALAAEYDHGGAQYNLATMYEAGLGVEQDLSRAYMWTLLARDNDVPDASLLMASLRQQMTQAQLDSAETAYAEWVLKYRS